MSVRSVAESSEFARIVFGFQLQQLRLRHAAHEQFAGELLLVLAGGDSALHVVDDLIVGHLGPDPTGYTGQNKKEDQKLTVHISLVLFRLLRLYAGRIAAAPAFSGGPATAPGRSS